MAKDKKVKAGAGRSVTTAGGAGEPQPAPPPPAAPMSIAAVFKLEQAGFPGVKVAKDGTVTHDGKVYGKVERYESSTHVRGPVGNISMGVHKAQMWVATANGERTPSRGHTTRRSAIRRVLERGVPREA